MGDIVSLVEKAAQTIDAEKAMKVADKMRKGKFDLEDLSDQLGQVEKLGGMGGIMGMLPGMGKIKEQMAAANIDEKMIKRQRAIISSMTPAERRNPDLLKASRKKRIASGSGMKVEDINRLLKQHRQMADMMKALGGAGGKRGALGKMASMFGMGSGNPLAGMAPRAPSSCSSSKPCRSRWAAVRVACRPCRRARRRQAAGPRRAAARPGRGWLQPFGGKKK